MEGSVSSSESERADDCLLFELAEVVVGGCLRGLPGRFFGASSDWKEVTLPEESALGLRGRFLATDEGTAEGGKVNCSSVDCASIDWGGAV